MKYDVALKVLLPESAGIVMRELAGVVTRWINVELPEVRNPRVDMLGETADGMLVHIELQSHHDPEMALRMAEYCLDQAGAVREIVGKLSAAESGRESYLQILMILAGLRELE